MAYFDVVSAPPGRAHPNLPEMPGYIRLECGTHPFKCAIEIAITPRQALRLAKKLTAAAKIATTPKTEP